MTHAIKLRRIVRNEQQLRQRIGYGLRWHYQLNGESGWLRLCFSDITQTDNFSCWQSEVGPLALSTAGPLLALFSDCPTLTLASDADSQWYWPWWNQQLAPELQTLFGSLMPDPEPAQAGSPTLVLVIDAMLGEQRARSLLSVSLTTLNRLLNKNEWQMERQPLSDGMMLTLPIIIGELTLPLAALRTLRQGDVVLPETLRFTPEGYGILPCASLLLSGELRQPPGALAHFFLTETEMIDVSLNPDEATYAEQNDPEEEWDNSPVNSAVDFAPLPLSLSVRCGQLKLTLGELQRLNAGSMVLIENVTPGEAILCHGDYPLAKGELVDVEGQLGLQITHMLPDSKHVLAGDD